MYAPDERFREVFNLLERHIERRYGVPVIIRDVKDPFTGDLDGAEIHVDHAVDAEEALFVMTHLFGHTVQWNISEEARKIGTEVQRNPSEAQMQRLHLYESEACRYSLQLFHETGVTDLDAWLSDFAACDFEYLSDFYRTGRKRPFRSFWKEGAERLKPLPIPEFIPTRWHARWEGVVV